MKKYALIIMFIISLCLTGCNIEPSNREYRVQEQPHLYWKDIDVVVTDIDKRHWFASTHWYTINLTVESEEYGLIDTFEIEGSGSFGCPKEWNYEEGQIVKAQLYSWVMDSTGEVIKREIHEVY